MTRNYIDLVGKTLGVLEALDSANGSLSIAQLSKKTGLVKSTVFRILYSLKEHGYVEQRGNRGEYRLTVKVAGLGRTILDNRPVKALAHPHLQKLRDVVNETVALGILDNGQPVMAEILDSQQSVRVVLSMAAVIYFHATALGKAMAAYLPQNLVEQRLYLQGIPKLTENTITRKKQVFKVLSEVRKTGYAMNEEETHRDAIYIGVPIFGEKANVIGAINVGMPTMRFSEARKVELITLLKTTSYELSLELGCSATRLRSLLVLEGHQIGSPALGAAVVRPAPRVAQADSGINATTAAGL